MFDYAQEMKLTTMCIIILAFYGHQSQQKLESGLAIFTDYAVLKEKVSSLESAWKDIEGYELWFKWRRHCKYSKSKSVQILQQSF